MGMKAYRRILVHNARGELVRDSGLVPCNSYVRQFLDLVEAFFKRVDKTAKDVDGNPTIIYDADQNANLNGVVHAGVGVDAFGIVVGTNAGITPEDNANYKLDTKILHSGTGEAGRMNYQQGTFVAPQVIAGNVDFSMSRAFINETSAGITIKEIGIICKNIANTKYHLLLRDVVSDTLVGVGETATVVYTLRTTA